jgi:DNA helicase-2/ATP-dependent DNA helicase PcrA
MDDAKEHDDWTAWGRYILQYNKALEAAQKNKSGVVLSTMHCSKGLEWKHVFIIDCVDEICPYIKAKDAAAIEEERRLFYVAMTRAKEHLYLYSYEENNGKRVKPSPFLPV